MCTLRKIALITALSTLLFFQVSAQSSLCSGNLGENIFTEGDFGSGAPNILPLNPGFAPGYQYTTNPPPDDGFYVITNSTAVWQDIFQSWGFFEDNSDDPNGYMMLVNADFSPGLFFQRQITDLCENTTYEFSADLRNVIRQGQTGFILPNVSFLLDGVEQFSTGDVPQNNAWITYGFTFTTTPGVTEMTLSLRNNAPGGFGNDIALDNISFRACGPSAFVDTDQQIFRCADENNPVPMTADLNVDDFFIQWQTSTDGGLTWTDIVGATDQVLFHDNFSPGSYLYRFLSASEESNLLNFKCRIVSDVVTIMVEPIFYNFTDTLCQGLTFNFDGQALNESGNYTGNFISQRGCDSIVTLDLVFVENELSMAITPTLPSCVGTPDGQLLLSDGGNGGLPLVYAMDDLENTDGNFSGLMEGTFLLSVADRFGCTVDSSFTLLVPDPFLIDLGEPLQLAFGETSRITTFNSTLAYESLSWSPSTYLSCTDCETPEIIGAQTITYVLSATNAEGCVAIDSLQVIVNRERIRVYIPNAISPNNDGINDRLNIFAFDQLVERVNLFQVYDRWGNQLYSDNDVRVGDSSSGWDGTFRGDPMPTGAYVYLVELTLIDGSVVQQSGQVNLLR